MRHVLATVASLVTRGLYAKHARLRQPHCARADNTAEIIQRRKVEELEIYLKREIRNQ